jgi:hypothetical protein
MTEASTMPIPAPAHWTWGPSRKGFGGYVGICTVGPLTFTITVNQCYSDGWELQATSTLAAVKMASHRWEVESLACTPDGIIAEVTKRDVLRQLAETTRRRVAEAARLLEEFDVLTRACAEDVE